MLSQQSQQQQQQQPASLLDEDFEVIDPDQSPPSGVESINPYEMSLVSPSAPAAQQDQQQQLARQLAEVSSRVSSLAGSLASNGDTLAKLRDQMKQQQQQQLPETLLPQYEQMKQELHRLRIRQEEWQQTADDYLGLKNQYNLLANTKERLEAERTVLLARLQQQQASAATDSANSSSAECDASSSKVKDDLERALEERLQQALAAEQAKWRTDSEAAAAMDSHQQGTNISIEEMSLVIAELEEQLMGKQKELEETKSSKDAVAENLRQSEERSRPLESKVDQMAQKIAQLEAEVQDWQAKLRAAERSHRVELDDLRLNSDVQQLEELRHELERRQKRHEEQARVYGDSDQAVNDIIQAAEAEKKVAQVAFETLVREAEAMKAALAENGRRLEATTGREMELRDQLGAARQRLERQDEERRLEVRRLKEEARSAESAHQTILAALRETAGQLEVQLAKETAAAEALRRREAELSRLCGEGDATVQEVLAASEADQRDTRARADDLQRRLEAAEAVVGAKAHALTEALDTVANLRCRADNLQASRVSLERQLQDSKVKSDEAVNLAGRLRDQLHTESARAARRSTELTDLRLEHTRLRAQYSAMEHRITELMSQEHQMQSRVAQSEENMELFRRTMQENQRDFDLERSKCASLRVERDNLVEQMHRMRASFGQ